MGALSGTLTERGAKSLAAGCDVVLNCHGEVADMAEVADALPAMTDAARARLDTALHSVADAAAAGNHAALIAKRDALLELAKDAA